MNLNELLQTRSKLILDADKIVKEGKANGLTDEQRGSLDKIYKEVEDLSKDIEIAKRQEDLNKEIASKETATERKAEPTKKSLGVSFREFLNDFVNGTGKPNQVFKFNVRDLHNELVEQRADPLLSTTTSAIINKNVANQLFVTTVNSEARLRAMGVPIYTGLTGNLVLPSALRDTASNPNENIDVSTANYTPIALTLAGRRFGKQQTFTPELLNQTNPAIYTGLVANLYSGLFESVEADLYDNIRIDAVDSSTTQAAGLSGALTFADIVALESGIAGDITNGAYVTTKTIAGKLKTLPTSTYQPNSWTGKVIEGELNGYPAYGLTTANTNDIYFGDFSKAAIGQWGDITILVDPYTYGSKGELKVIVSGMFDTGWADKYSIKWIHDASVA